jgi:hypothetical protein
MRAQVLKQNKGKLTKGTAEPALPGRQCRPLEGVARSAAGVGSTLRRGESRF